VRMFYFSGEIDEVRVSKVVRYDKDFTPVAPNATDADTLALYHCDEGQGDILTDSSGNGHHGKVVGAKWVEVEGPKRKTWTHREMAEWVLARGGKLWVDDRDMVSRNEDLPTGNFTVKVVRLEGVSNVGDAEAAIMAKWPGVGFSLANSGISDKGLRLLAQTYLAGRSLSVGGSGFTGEGFDAFEGKTITTLVLQPRVNFSAAGWEAVARVGSTKTWSMWDSNLDDDAFIEIVRQHPEISSLGVSKTKLTDNGLRALARHQELSTLDISETPISDAGLAALKSCPKLTFLNARKTKVTAAGVAELQKALPNCVIQW
jgi:hypothetical protein